MLQYEKFLRVKNNVITDFIQLCGDAQLTIVTSLSQYSSIFIFYERSCSRCQDVHFSESFLTNSSQKANHIFPEQNI